MTDTAPATSEAPAATTDDAAPQPRKAWWVRHYTFAGTTVGSIFLWFSMTPSLLPRGPLFQGLVSGGAGAIGYGIGVFAVWLVRYMRSKDSSPPAPRWAWIVLVAAGAIGLVLAVIWFHRWQDDVRDLMGVPRLTFWDYPLAAAISVVTLFVLVEIGQLVGKLVRFLVRQLNRVAPPRVSAVVVVTLLLALTIAVLNGVVVRFAMSTINKTFAAVNDETDPEFAAPQSVLRSGGPQSGQALFEAVDELVRQMPEAQRPKLVVFGESLGSFGGEAPFLALNDLIARTDGTLFSGPTFNNTIWADLTRNRDRGSPEWLPIYDKGANVRFVAEQRDLQRPHDPWEQPRVVYLQHASDPIAWWNPDLLFAEPDWLREPRGYDVSPDMEWIPIVTFLQVSADMAVAVDVPDGHGHVYVRNVADAWASILLPPGWSQEKTGRLRPLLRSDENS